MPKPIDLTGERYGRLTVLKCVGKDKHGRLMWECQCDCGQRTIVQSGNLRSGHTKSCGCLEIENRKIVCRTSNRTHGATHTRLFNIWQSMLERCQMNGEGLKHYGKRGIFVCDEWKKFEDFRDWAEKTGYDETAPRGACTLERNDVNGPYSPENCRWATNKEQQNNRRNNYYITFNGETKTLMLWTEELNLPYGTIRHRLRVLGWSVEDAFCTPIRCKRGRLA